MPMYLLPGVSVFLAVAYYFFVPQLSLNNSGLIFLLWVAAVICAVVTYIKNVNDYDRRHNEALGRKVFVPIAFFTISFVAAILFSSGFMRASSYHQLLGEEKASDFKKSLPPLDLTNAPLVSEDMAMRAAEKKLADIPALGSQTRVGHLQKQLVRGHLYWVGFLQHRGIATWWSQGATPGYVMVSATDPSDVQLVTELDGKKLQLRYLPTAYFGDDAKRHLRFSGYATAGLTDYSPEIDDEGRPFYVVTVFERRVGFSGADPVGVVTLDVQSGQTKFYNTEDAPKWIDRIQPEDIVEEQLSDRLEYVHGWFNPSHKDQLTISGNLDVIYSSDGRAYFFAGLASTGRDGGVVGFVLVDTRTKEVTRYSMVGVTESVAQSAAQGVYPEKHYSATNALPFMVDGVPAYVMTLRDGTGIARAYAMVDIRDFQKVAVGDTLTGTSRLFQAKLNMDRTHLDAASRADEVQIKGTVVRIGSEVRAGVTNYVLMLDTTGNRRFVADVNRSEDLAVTQRGDQVEIRTLDNDQRTQPMLEFKNLGLEAMPKVSARPTKQ
jgi:hypothetical protein